MYIYMAIYIFVVESATGIYAPSSPGLCS